MGDSPPDDRQHNARVTPPVDGMAEVYVGGELKSAFEVPADADLEVYMSPKDD